MAFAGCALPDRNWTPAQDPAALSSTSFLHYLASVPWATMDEATRALLLTADGEERFGDFAARVDELVRRRALRREWVRGPRQILDRGTLAYAVRRLCDLPPSLNETALGSWGAGDRRFALQTCVHHGLIKQGRAEEGVSGGELLAVITHIDAHLERGQEMRNGEFGMRNGK